MKFNEIEISPAVAYQMGRVDALDGSAPTRFSGTPTVSKTIGDGQWGCSKNEAKAIEQIRAQYHAGYKSTEQHEARIVAFARQLRGCSWSNYAC